MCLLGKLCTETGLCRDRNAFRDDMDCKWSKDLFIHIVLSFSCPSSFCTYGNAYTCGNYMLMQSRYVVEYSVRTMHVQALFLRLTFKSTLQLTMSGNKMHRKNK
jgi:hypothetical protein